MDSLAALRPVGAGVTRAAFGRTEPPDSFSRRFFLLDSVWLTIFVLIVRFSLRLSLKAKSYELKL
jgi:hypothetical protein